MYTNKEKVAIWLNVFDNISLKKQHDLLNLYDNIEDVWNNFENDKNKILEVVDELTYCEMLFSLDDNFLKNYIKNHDDQGIKFVTISSKDYPDCLRETNSPPIVLYCKGDTSLLKSDCLAVVGSRRCTKYGKDMTYKFAYDIASSGMTIVSGLADGVDGVAHIATLDAKGKTIAVMGSGHNVIYPSNNAPLAKRIIENGGLVVTEYKPNEKPQNYHFPARNRIIAGLSKGVLITEATENSGSLHTKEYALENNRDIFAIPGRLNDIYSKGCNLIIKNCQSSMVLSPDDIITHYGKSLKLLNDVNTVQVNMDENIILQALDKGETHYDELLQKCGLEPKKLNTLLMRLELKGLVNKLAGNVYSK